MTDSRSKLYLVIVAACYITGILNFMGNRAAAGWVLIAISTPLLLIVTVRLRRKK